MAETEKKVLIIGDVILDEYIDGTFTGPAAETGMPVFCTRSVSYMAGGAGNILLNIIAAGIKAVLMGVIGRDRESSVYETLLKKESADTSMMLIEPDRTLSVKTRYMVNEHQVFRCDREAAGEIQEETERQAVNCINRRIREFDIVVIVDYEKGMMTKRLKEEIVRLAGMWRKKVIVDTKSPKVQAYQDVFLIKTNHEELGKITGLVCDTHENTKKAASVLCQVCSCAYVLTTCAQHGLILTANDKNSFHIKSRLDYPAVCTIGAGDTVTAYLIIGIARGMDLIQCIGFASTAAGIAVASPKTTVVNYGAVIRKYLPLASEKIVTQDILVKKLKNRGDKTVIFTNGCFDILHKGHIYCLNMAAYLGDILIVAVNSDASVARIKGKNRPVLNYLTRAEAIAMMECVTYVVDFEAESILSLIEKIHPDVLVKGNGYTESTIVGSDLVKGWGGRVEVIQGGLGESISTTGIIHRVLDKEE